MRNYNSVLEIRILHNVIREFGSYKDGTIYININDLPLYDKKMMLMTFCDSVEEYEKSTATQEGFNALWHEHREFMQDRIEQEIGTVYCEDMQEMGLTLRHHKDNGEAYWGTK